MVFLSLIPANPVCVLWRQMEGKWKSLWVAGRGMYHSCFFKRRFTQRSLRKVVSDLTAWTSFRNAGTAKAWRVSLFMTVLFYFCRMTGIPACFLGSAQSKQVKDSIRGWVLAKLSAALGCDRGGGRMEGVGCLPAPSPLKLLVLAHPWNLALGILFAFTQAECVGGYSRPPCLLAGEMGLVDSAVFWFIPDFSQVLDLYVSVISTTVPSYSKSRQISFSFSCNAFLFGGSGMFSVAFT